jgi:hypothetical protein
MVRLFLSFLIPLPFFTVCIVMIAWNDIFGDIEPETIDRQTLIRVLQLRDFCQFSPDLIERFTFRAEQEFGRHSANKPVFEFSPIVKEVHIYFQTHRSSQRSHLENNLNVMAKGRYFQWMQEYQSAPPVRKAALMKDVLEDLYYWQDVYLDYVRSLGLPEPSELELLLDFQRMTEGFKEGASPEEVKMIDSFAKGMIAAEAGKSAAEAGKALWEMFTPKK